MPYELYETKIDLAEEYEGLVIFYLNFLPDKIKSKIRENVKVIKHGDEAFGNAHYIRDSKEIKIGPALSSTYFLEILGHELAHAINVEEEFKQLCGGNLLEEHLLCDHFSKYLLYGEGKYLEEFERVYGQRDPERLDKLQEEIKRNDDKIEEMLRENVSKGVIHEEQIGVFFNRDARFLN